MMTQRLADDISAMSIDVLAVHYTGNKAVSCEEYNCIGIDEKGLVQGEIRTILAHKMGLFILDIAALSFENKRNTGQMQP